MHLLNKVYSDPGFFLMASFVLTECNCHVSCTSGEAYLNTNTTLGWVRARGWSSFRRLFRKYLAWLSRFFGWVGLWTKKPVKKYRFVSEKIKHKLGVFVEKEQETKTRFFRYITMKKDKQRTFWRDDDGTSQGRRVGNKKLLFHNSGSKSNK